jgi:lipoprotein-anchoring transpeptidase ErfK/SrfK
MGRKRTGAHQERISASVGSSVVRRLPLVATLCLALALSACGGGDKPSLAPSTRPPAPTTTTTLPPYVSLVAEAVVDRIAIYQTPAEALLPAASLPNPWFVNDDPTKPVKQVFLIRDKKDDWYEILLPLRPNGSTGWVRAKDVRISQNPFSIKVELGAHRITVNDGATVLLQEPIAIGKAATPTPPGTYYLRVLLQAPNPNTVYGPYAYPLSGHSEVLTSFNGGDGELGIHGNNDASVLGQSVTAGCIRMSNDGITRLASILPLGTPVEIVP